ncbi:DUF6286 domain-containing protein [Frankia sp. Cppng1_Ct_nod]|uniref:DUF6286 domain-containing protein n=1 Tax=Frankia sp. Cppng1_Ct_nod TaxID=2897162 RepID=UPI001041A2A5|nr:DUF6286 domain-containing protein [Frankia sp. Cppng1_Ct_nod]
MRVTNRIVAALLAAAIAAVGVIAIVEMVNAALDESYSIIDWPSAVGAMTRNAWSDTGPTVLGAVLSAVGVVLLLLGLRRGRVSWFVVRPSSAGTATFASRSGISRSLRDAATDVDGVTHATVRVRRRTAKVKVDLRPRTAADAPTQVHHEVSERLASFDLATPPKVKLKTSRPASGDGNVVPEPTASPVAPQTPPAATPPAAPTGTGSATAENFGTSTGSGRTSSYPVGLDLTKPDTANDREEQK